MAWSYRRRIKIIPGVHLNFSKSGISTSIGVKGASVTIGKNGSYLNAGIPGLGIYSRQKLGGNNKPVPHDVAEQDDHQPATEPVYNPGLPVDNIFSADPQEITSQDMQGVKETILTAHEQRLALATDLQDVKKSLAKSKNRLTISYIFLYGIIKKSISQKLKGDISSQKEAISQIREQIENSAVQLDFIFEDDLLSGYTNVLESFKNCVPPARSGT